MNRRLAMGPKRPIVLACLAGILTGPFAAAQDAEPVVHTLQVRDDIYMLVGEGGNITVQVGDDGILIVDTEFARTSEAVLQAIREISDRPIRYIVDTHHHGDHIGGNANLRQAGATVIGGNMPGPVPYAEGGGAEVISHENVLLRLSRASGEQAVDPALWPTDTFFNDEKRLYFNGEGIRLIHQPNAHTDGDIVVFFRRSDVVAAGDVFVTSGWPFIDIESGGSYQGLVAALNHLVDLIIPVYGQDGGTLVVPGHGRLSGLGDVLDFREMVIVVGDRVRHLIEQGMTLEQVQAARPAMDYAPVYASEDGFLTTEQFVESVYRSLAQGEN